MTESGGSGVTTEGSSTTAEDSVLATMSRLLQAQTDALTAQTRAAAAHHLPPLKPFTGEGQQSRDDSFDQWLERFEERACLVGWSKSQQLHQLKLLLEETALRAFRMFPEADREDYDKAKSALKSRFRAVDIEELRGLEFHHKVQSDETVEELGMELQRLGNKAFPSIRGRELDRLLKGRFFQALHVRWQRKLGAPKTDETFKELYDRARMLEQREKQYAVSAATRDASGDGPKRSEKFTRQRSGHSGGGQKRPPKPSSGSAGQSQGTSSASPPWTLPTRVCYTCQPGHFSRECPQRAKHPEASGRTQGATPSSRTATLEPKSASVESASSSELSTPQLQKLLAQRLVDEEQTLMMGDANTVTTGVETATSQAVGPTLCMPVNVGGVTVEAFVDTGSQSTIISRAMLHEIARHWKSQGQPLPVLEEPTVRLFGKDGRGGGRELVITAQLQIPIEADGESTVVPVFVQPESAQQCLLGMNVLPALGLTMCRANGEPLITRVGDDSVVSYVRLVQSSTVPSLKGCFLRVEVADALPKLGGGDCPPVLFEPCKDVLEPMGLCMLESLVAVDGEGFALVPVENCGGEGVHLGEGMEVGTVRCVEKVIEDVCGFVGDGGRRCG